MVSKIVLDANILLDLILRRSDDENGLRRLYQKITDHTLKGYVTTSIIHTVSYWLKKEMDVAQTKRILIAVMSDFKLIEATHATMEDALYSDMKDIENALQYYTAVQNRIDFFISRDKNFIKASKSILPVMHPKEFIEHYIE